jgi:hypothetical protein
MPPRRNNQLPPSVEPDLPALNPASQTSIDNSLASVDPNYISAMSDGSLDVAPEDVVNNLPQDAEVRRAEPNLKPTGAFMNVGFIQQLNNAATDEEFNAMYDALDPALQHVYDRSYKMEVSPKWAADTAQEFYQMQDERAKTAGNPRNQALEIQRKEKAQAAQDQIGLMRGVVNGVLEHPGFSGSVGAKNASFLFGMKGQPFSGTKEADFMAMLDQLKGNAFLQAFQSLKGGGPITDVEGQKATEAIVRAQNSQSEEGFRKSMNEVLDVLGNAEKRLGDGAAQGAAASAAPAAPAKPRRVSGGITYEKGDDGLWNPVQ